MIRKLTLLAAALFFSAASVGMAQEMVVSNPVALDHKGVLKISGLGFPPYAPVYLLFTSADGVTADIVYALAPEPVSNAEGQWMTTWSYGRFVSKKLVSSGAFRLIAADEDYTELASTTLIFQK